MAKLPDVKVGEIWEDCDKRMNGRQIQITAVDESYVYAYTIAKVGDGRDVRIMRMRMRPTAHGFRLVRPVGERLEEERPE